MVPGQWVIVRRPVLSVLGKMVQSGWGKKIWPLKGCQGRQWCPQRCPWCAGSRLQVASWAQPSALPQEAACLWERLREYAVPYITAKACLKHENNIPLISSHLPHRRVHTLRDMTAWKAEQCYRHMSRWEFCLCACMCWSGPCFQHASAFSCQRSPSVWCVTRAGQEGVWRWEWGGWQVGERGMVT